MFFILQHISFLRYDSNNELKIREIYSTCNYEKGILHAINNKKELIYKLCGIKVLNNVLSTKLFHSKL